MKAELELARKHIQRWANHPTIISAELARKDIPNWRELMWVYRAVIWNLIATMIIAASSAILFSDWTWHTPATVADVGGVILWTASMAAIIHHTFSGESSVFKPTTVGLNWKGRRHRAVLARNLRRMPWHGQRINRMKEGDGRYSQLSVWLHPSGEGVQFRILEHKPITMGFIGVLLVGRIWIVRVWEKGGRPAQEHLPISNPLDEIEKILEKRAEFEELAEQAEEQMYQNAIAKDHLTAAVLRIRR